MLRLQTAAKRRKIDETHSADSAAHLTEAPEWLDRVRAHQEAERQAQIHDIASEWKSIGQQRGWGTVIKKDRDTIQPKDADIDPRVFSTPFDLHRAVHEATEGLSDASKYKRAIEVVSDYYGDAVCDFSAQIPLFLDNTRNDKRAADTYLGKLAEDFRLIDVEEHGLLSTDEFETYTNRRGAFHEQRNVRTMSLGELKNRDQEKRSNHANHANLRHARAEKLFNLCRIVNISCWDKEVELDQLTGKWPSPRCCRAHWRSVAPNRFVSPRIGQARSRNWRRKLPAWNLKTFGSAEPFSRK